MARRRGADTSLQDKTSIARDMPSLERVFNRLCNYAKKIKFVSAITGKKAKKEKLLGALKQPDNHKMIDPSTGNFLTVSEMKEELAVIGQEIAECNKHIARANTSGRKDISWKDLHFALKDLGKPTPKEDVLNMIWEVDDDLNGYVNWEEFLTMYKRAVFNNTGLEPTGLYNVVQFMVYDKDYSGLVSVDETMMMLYQRYGKARLGTELERIFGKNPDGDSALDLTQYLKAVSVEITLEDSPSKAKNKKRTGRYM